MRDVERPGKDLLEWALSRQMLGDFSKQGEDAKLSSARCLSYYLMLPVELAHRKAFWQGLLLSFAFRVFAYGLLWFIFHAFGAKPPVSSGMLVVAPLERLVRNSSVALVPFIAGFLGGYFWRRLELRESMKAIWASALLFFLMVTVVVLVLGKGENLPFEMLLVPLDVTLCLIGSATGSDFWRSRLGRQFLGNFSTRDDGE